MLRRIKRAATLAGILAAATAAAVLLMRAEQRWYLGSGGAAELTEASRALADSLTAPVQLTAAIPAGHVLRRHLQALAGAYRRTHPDLRLEFVDPEADEGRARELGLVRTGEIMVRYGDRYERIATPSEARLSAALERLQRREERFVAWLTGHGERPIEGRRNDGMADFVAALERKGYTVLPLSLARTAVIPDNASLLVVAAPERPLRPGERRIISKYVARGGALLWLGEPGSPAALPDGLPLRLAGGAVTDPKTRELLAVDDPQLLLIDSFPDHPTTGNLRSPLLLSGATAVATGEGESWRARALLRGASRQRLRTEDGVRRSPLSLGIALSRDDSGAQQRLAVLGDADLFTSAYLGNGDNLRFGLSLVDWLVGADAYVGRYVSAAGDQRLDLDRTGAVAFAVVVLGLVPGGLLLGGLVAWRRQRRS